MCSNLSRCGSTVLDVLVPLFKRSVRKTYLFPPRANVFSLISLFHPLSFLFVRAHDEFSLEISSDCFFFFFFFFLLSPSPSPFRPSSLVVVFFHEMEVRWPLSARELRRRGFFFFFFFFLEEIYALTRQCKLSFPVSRP